MTHCNRAFTIFRRQLGQAFEACSSNSVDNFPMFLSRLGSSPRSTLLNTPSYNDNGQCKYFPTVRLYNVSKA